MEAVLRFLQRNSSIRRIFPFLEWFPELKQFSTIKSDVIAGLTVALLLVPQSMAYAHLAGLPVYMGLYSAFIPPMIAALFGSSRVLSTGPVPVTSLLTAVTLMPLAATGSIQYLEYVVLLTLLTGLIQLVLGIMRFGVVVNFLSYPVILGFINGVAIIIASMQISNLFGVSAVSAPHYYQTVWQVMNDVLTTPHWPTLAIAALTFFIIFGGRKFFPNLPHTLLAVVITTIISWAIGYEKLETIQVDQIANVSAAKMLGNYQRFPQEFKARSEVLKKEEEKLQLTMDNYGANTEELAVAVNKVNQAKWQLDRLLVRYNFDVGALSRLRFHRMVTKDNQIIFFVAEEMTPLGKVQPGQWRISQFLPNARLIVQSGGEVVGYINPGLPSYKPVVYSWDDISRLFMAALVIAFVSFTEAITIAKRIATETRQRINVNQELVGQGLAKCVGSFFQSMPVSGGFTRTAVNFYAGAQTGFSSLVSGLVVMVVLLWLTPLFYYLPYATLAAVVMVGVLGLLDVKEMWRVWMVSRSEGIVTLSTFLMTIVLAPKLAHAVIFGILFSLAVYLYETMRPRFKELIRNAEGDLVEISGENVAESCYLISIVRFNGSLYFANVSYFEQEILKLISAKQKLRYIILDCVSINKLDASGLESLRSLCIRLEEAGMELWFTRVRPPVFNVLKRGGLYEQLGPHHFYKNNEEAIVKLTDYLGAKHMNTCPLARK
jgi:SulP family sulfate permease